MMVKDDSVFGIPTNSFGISPSKTGYTLEYSADGQGFTAYPDPVPAGEVLIVNGVPKGFGYRLSGNVGEVYVQY